MSAPAYWDYLRLDRLRDLQSGLEESEEFLAQSRYYEDRFGRSGQWEAIRTMGQKLIPEERLFR